VEGLGSAEPSVAPGLCPRCLGTATPPWRRVVAVVPCLPFISECGALAPRRRLSAAPSFPCRACRSCRSAVPRHRGSPWRAVRPRLTGPPPTVTPSAAMLVRRVGVYVLPLMCCRSCRGRLCVAWTQSCPSCRALRNPGVPREAALAASRQCRASTRPASGAEACIGTPWQPRSGGRMPRVAGPCAAFHLTARECTRKAKSSRHWELRRRRQWSRRAESYLPRKRQLARRRPYRRLRRHRVPDGDLPVLGVEVRLLAHLRHHLALEERDPRPSPASRAAEALPL
jgi:hypothetical protein